MGSKVGVGEGSQQRRVASRAVPHGGALGGEGVAGQWERSTQLLTLASEKKRVQTPGQVSLRRGRRQGTEVRASEHSQWRESKDLSSERSP